MYLAQNKLPIYLLKASFVLLPFSGSGSPIKIVFGLLIFALATIGAKRLISNAGKKDTFYGPLALITIFAVSLHGLTMTLIGLGQLADTVSFSLCVTIGLSIPVIMKNHDDRTNFIIFILFLSVIHVVAAIYQIKFGIDFLWGNPLAGGRPTGLFSWAAPVVGSFVGISAFLYFGLSEEKKKKYRVIYLFLLFGILIGGNRSVFVLHIIVLMITFLMSLNKMKSIQYLFTAFLFLFCFFLYQDEILDFLANRLAFSENLIYRITSLFGDIISEQETKRIATWRQSVCMIGERPFFGYGLGKFRDHFVNFLYCAPRSEGLMPHPHNFILDIVSIFGLAFGSIFLAIIWILLISSYYTDSCRHNQLPLFVLITIVSPLNTTHGMASFWWAFLIFVLLGFSFGRISR